MQEYGEACHGHGSLVEMSNSHKQLILDEHNEKRNKVAAGELIGFQPARRMATIVSKNLCIYTILIFIYMYTYPFSFNCCYCSKMFKLKAINSTLKLFSLVLL